jgi:hypothetical protein
LSPPSIDSPRANTSATFWARTWRLNSVYGTASGSDRRSCIVSIVNSTSDAAPHRTMLSHRGRRLGG